MNRLWKTERGSFLCSGYSIFVFGKSFRLCLSLISCTIEVGAKEELVPGCMQDVDVFSQALILRASCILDPRCDSVVVSRGLLMILAVPVRCCLVGLFPSVKVFFLVMCRLLGAFFPAVLCVPFSLI